MINLLRHSLLVKVALMACWIPVAAAIVNFEFHESAPGAALHSSGHIWPKFTTLSRSDVKPTLVLFIHPQCPCTGSSIENLDRLVSASPGSCDVTLVFLQPSGFALDWVKKDLWVEAQRIPGARFFVDEEGKECRRFGALTSGTAILFDPDGNEVFCGGITSERGHAGDSLATVAIQGYLQTGKISIHTAPVFGCALFTESSVGGK